MMKAVRVPLLVSLLISLAVPLMGQTTIANSIADCQTGLGTPGGGEYPVDIVFSGINVFDRSTDGLISVRIPNLVGGRAVIKDGQGNIVREAIKSHIAYILTDAQTAKPLIDAGLAVQPAYYEGSCYVYYRLTNEIVKALDSSAPPANNGRLCVTDASDGKYCPDAATDGSMYWLPSFKKVLGSAQVPDDPHFKNPDGTTIAGVVQVDRGYLQTVVNLPKKVWTFLEKKGDPEVMRQAIAQEVHWHMRGTTSQFVLRLTKPDNTYVDLNFAPQNAKGVVLDIFNSPIDETGPIHQANPMNTDPHFRAYYEFVKAFDVKKGPLPFKSSKSCQNGSLASNPSLSVCVGCPNLDPSCLIVNAETQKAMLSSQFKSKKHKAAKKAGKNASKGAMAGMAFTPSPLPSGLNCAASQWP
jgi:hypothetical protein